jgi:replication factor C subunit 1
VYDLAFRRPDASQVRARIMTIAYREGLKLGSNVVDQFVEGTHADIRQILNLMSTYRLSKDELAFDESKKVYLNRTPFIAQFPSFSN